MINIELIEDIKENENLNHLASEEIWNNEWFEENDSRDNRSSADRFFNVGIPNNTNINKKDYNQNNSGDGSSNSGIEKNYNNNSNKDADFSELYKKIRKKMEELKITKKKTK